jgi:hypothetical protein
MLTVNDRRRLGDITSHVDQEELLSAESAHHVARPNRCPGDGREVTAAKAIQAIEYLGESARLSE